ncbi:MAG: hypothetical protein ACMG6S_02615, partial [Byssovorax sp.]
MVTRTILPKALFSLAAALLGALAAIAVADEPPPSTAADPRPAAAPSEAQPQVHHAPLSSSFAHEPLRFEVELDHPELVRWLGL